MKLIPKPSVCPYCKTVYRYTDIGKIKRKRKETCYHCGKTFSVNKKSYFILAIEILILYIAINFLALEMIGSVSFFSLFAMNLIPAVAAALIYPFYIEFKQEDNA